eukprot:XP_011681466.1 PREDICTED: choline transporter-like protein 4 [Strongylocentrotus purpuratus]
MGKDKHASREELAEYPPETPSHGHSSGKYGTPKKYDPSFHGPIKNRSCTDVICCILFIVAVGGMIGVGVLGKIVSEYDYNSDYDYDILNDPSKTPKITSTGISNNVQNKYFQYNSIPKYIQTSHKHKLSNTYSKRRKLEYARSH